MFLYSSGTECCWSGIIDIIYHIYHMGFPRLSLLFSYRFTLALVDLGAVENG